MFGLNHGTIYSLTAFSLKMFGLLWFVDFWTLLLRLRGILSSIGSCLHLQAHIYLLRYCRVGRPLFTDYGWREIDDTIVEQQDHLFQYSTKCFTWWRTRLEALKCSSPPGSRYPLSGKVHHPLSSNRRDGLKLFHAKYYPKRLHLLLPLSSSLLLFWFVGW